MERAEQHPAYRKAQNSPRRGYLNRNVVALGCMAVFILIANAAISALIALAMAPKTVSFDMADTVNSFMGQVANQKMTEDEIKTITAKFNLALDDALSEFQQRNRVMILVTPAVVAGVEDITTDIQERVAARMGE